MSSKSQLMSPADLIRAVDLADSADSLLDAVEALAEARSLDAIPTLIEVLGFNNPGAAVAAVDGLIVLGEPAVQPLLDLIDARNYTARSWAVRALSGIGDPRSLEILCHAASSDFSTSVRRAAARGLGAIRWEMVPAEALTTVRQRAMQLLMQTLEDGEWVVRYAAVVGLQQFGEALLAKISNPSEKEETAAIALKQIRDGLETCLRTEVDIAVSLRIARALSNLSEG